jgi:hypothetical protein
MHCFSSYAFKYSPYRKVFRQNLCILMRYMYIFIVMHTILYYYSLLLLLLSSAVSSWSSPSPLCKVFAITYVKRTVFLGYIVLQLFCIHSLWYIQCRFPCYLSYSHISTFPIRPLCVVPYMPVFCNHYHHCCQWINFEMSVIQNRSLLSRYALEINSFDKVGNVIRQSVDHSFYGPTAKPPPQGPPPPPPPSLTT